MGTHFLNDNVFLPRDLPSFSLLCPESTLYPVKFSALFVCVGPDTAAADGNPSPLTRTGRDEIEGEMGRKRQKKMTNEACERQKNGKLRH